MNHLDGVALTIVVVSFVIVTCVSTLGIGST